MKFSELAEYLEKLEGTGSRLEMTRILAELLARVGPLEGKIIAYLSAGMLGPKYDNPETGMAEKQVIKAIERIGYGGILSEFKKMGDLGLAVKKLKEEGTLTPTLLDPVGVDRKKAGEMKLSEVHEKLLQIAGTSGEGSQEGKINLLGELLGGMTGKEAKYAVKIVLGRMRSGFSDMTVLDALSWMKTGDKSLRGEIEKIYNVRADLGEVVSLLVGGQKDICDIRVEPKVGTPVLVARAERAKSATEIWERLGEAVAEHKLDGLRIQAHIKNSDVKLFSRGMENVTAMYPDIVEGLKKQVIRECILDGEMIAVGEDGRYRPFQETVQRKRKHDILQMLSKVPLSYYTFDVLMADGVNFLDKPNKERWEMLTKLVGAGVKKKTDVVRLMPRKKVVSVAEIEEFFKEAIAEGTEGIMVKKPDGIYRSGSRDFNWIKYKKSYDETGVADTIDAVVMGYDVGQGKRAGFGIGGFLIGVNKGKTGKFQTIAKIGTGLTDDEWREMKKRCDLIKTDKKPDDFEVGKSMECDVWVKPRIVVEIKADEITKSPMHTAGFALRFPRLVDFREMKPEDVATTAEIIRLFELQKKEVRKSE